MDNAAFETRAEFARRLKVSRAAVTQWAALGRLVLAEDGRVNVPASQTRLAATTNVRGGKMRAGGAGGAQPLQLPTTDELDFRDGTLTGARIVQARVKSRLDQVELDERLGRLIERSRFESAIADGMTAIISQFDTLAGRIAPRVAAETDVRKIQDMIDDEVARLRQDTADTLRAMIAGGGPTRQ